MIFTVGSALSFGWETFKKRPAFFFLVPVIVALVQTLVDLPLSAVDTHFKGPDGETPLVVTVFTSAIGFVAAILIAMGSTAFYLAAHDNPQTVQLSALWHPHPFWKYACLMILFVLMLGAGAGLLVGLVYVGNWPLVAIGALVVVLVGALLSAALIFAPLIVIDRERGPIEAIKESYRLTEGDRWRPLGLLLVSALGFMFGTGVLAKFLAGPGPYVFDPGTIFPLISKASPTDALGALAVISGIIVWFFITGLAVTHAYRVLSGTAGTRPAADAALAA